MPEELFSQTGGGRVGYSPWLALNATWPFASLTVTSQTITLKVPMKRYTFEKDTIHQLKRYQSILSTGLQIIHTRKDYPPFIAFWTFNFEVLKTELQKLGYSVDETVLEFVLLSFDWIISAEVHAYVDSLPCFASARLLDCWVK
jgi:hypothetical protein